MTEVAVIGAGTMGHALALVYALGGHQVRLTDSNQAILARAPSLMNTALDLLVEGGEVDPRWQQTLASQSVRLCDTLVDAATGADLVVEAIVEQPKAKQALYQQLDELMAADAILASNTSYLDIFPLVPAGRQKRTLIAHWYTPPYLVDLVDVVPGPETDASVVETVRATIQAMGKVPVVFRQFVPGYVANRIQAAITLEVFRLLDEGVVTPTEIDRSVIHGLALRLPILAILAKADFTGLPLIGDALANRTYTAPEPREQCDTLDNLLGQGHIGVMAGKGFFDWGDRSAEDLFRERDRKLLALKRALRDIKPMEGT